MKLFKRLQNITPNIYLASILFIISSCEKEIEMSVPASKEQLVVEASINTFSPILNYVFITKSLDYFNPDLSMGGLEGAQVFVTEGRLSPNNTDTVYDGAQTRFYNIYDIPGADTLFAIFEQLAPLKGVYLNPFFNGKENTPYLLNITMADGRTITGSTFIPKIVPIDIIKYEIRGTPDDSGRYDAFTSIYWTDPPEQNNYRMAISRGYYSPLLIGWGGADSFRTFDDEFLNNQERSYSFFRPFKTSDTLSVYFTSIGRKEFLFWQSFGQASNNASPFATPVSLKSNITGALGTFTGYAVSYKYLIFR